MTTKFPAPVSVSEFKAALRWVPEDAQIEVVEGTNEYTGSRDYFFRITFNVEAEDQ